jgi:hypothetical protein
MASVTLTANGFASSLGIASNDSVNIASFELTVDKKLTGITLTTDGGSIKVIGTNSITFGAHSNHTFTGTLAFGPAIGYTERITGTTYANKGVSA